MYQKLIVSIAIILNQTVALAQIDEDSLPPPPPPVFSTDSGAHTETNSTKTKPELTNKESSSKKDKLSQAGIEEITNENFPETIESFDFPNAEITDIVKAIGELTGKNFIIDPGVRGKITIVAPSKITVAEAYKAFLSALAINGYAVVPSGKFLKIRSARNAQRDGIETYGGDYYPNSDQMITRVINLKYIPAETINRDLRLLTSKDGEFSAFTATNSLIISDYGSNVERVMKIISQLDVPGFDDQLEVVPIRYAKAKDIAELVNKIVNKGDNKQANTGFSAGVPRFSRGGNNQNGSTSFTVIPDDRTNSLIVVGSKSGIDRVKQLISQLDFRIKLDDSGGIHVYYVKYGDAAKIQETLAGLIKDAGPKPSSGGGSPLLAPINPISGIQAPTEIFGGEVKITADKGTNALVIVASKQDYEVVLNLLSKIDIARDQVYVEAVIMEMKLTDSFKAEAGFMQFQNDGSGNASSARSGFNGFQDLGAMLSPTGGSGAILGFGNGEQLNIKVGSTTTKIPSLLGFINFLQVNTNANVLSTPQILALDNQEATIEVGDKVVVGVNTSQTAAGSQTVTPQFEDATIKLKIKPNINPKSNSVRMEIENSVKQISTAKSPTAIANQVQPLATRSIKTNIVVPNGDTAVLGGLMKEDDIESIQKVPILGDIPVLGWLFRSKSDSKEKTNLVVFLTPKIVKTESDFKTLRDKKIDQRLGFIKEMGGRDPYGKKIDEIQGVQAEVIDQGKTKE